MTTTAVPGLVDALVAAFTAAMPPGTAVLDGPWVARSADRVLEPPRSALYVATPYREDAAVSAVQSRMPGIGSARTETFELWCVAVCWLDGFAAMKAARDGAAAIVAAVEDVLRADPHLGGVVDHVGVGPGMEWLPVPGNQFSECDVAFQLSGRAFL